jgi:hypothetical protein
MARLLLLFSVLLSIVVCATSACTSKESSEAPTVYTNDATVAIMGGTRGGPAGWQDYYGEVTLHGWLEDMGAQPPVNVGFRWGPTSVSGTPTSSSYPNQCSATGTGVLYSAGLFEGQVLWQPSLQPDTTYYFRAYAQSNAGTAWGDEYTFHTNPGSALTVTNHGAADYTTTLEVVGQAMNRTSQTLSYASVAVAFKDAQGTVLETASYSTNVDIPGVTAQTPNGGLWSFDVWYPGTDASVVASYELSFSAG